MTDREKWIQVAEDYVEATRLLDKVGKLLREMGEDALDQQMYAAYDTMTEAIAKRMPDDAKMVGMAAATAAILAGGVG
jgi:hypothetical protein